MNETNEQQPTIDSLIDALAAVDSTLQAVALGVPIGAKVALECSKTVNIAVAALLEASRTEQLQREMIGLLEKLHNRAVDEREAMRVQLHGRG